MANEVITLDPSAVATNRTALVVSEWITADGVDWGDAEITSYVAEQARGEVAVDYRLPNRHVSIPFNLTTRGGTALATIRTKLQAKAALYQREGGWLSRTTVGGGTVYLDVVNATLHLGGDWMQAHADVDTAARLDLEVVPDFYGDEITLSDHTETSNPEIVFTESAVKGDMPGRVRVVVDNDNSSNDELGLIYAFRSRYYDSATTAASKYQAEELNPLDTAAKAALTGASGGTVVTHGTLSTNWTPVLGTNIGGTSYLTHTGTYRLFARCYSTSGTTVQARFVYDVGDLTSPAENDGIRMPGASNFYAMDFGEVRLDKVPVGTHRWRGHFQARGDAGGENFSVDRVWLVNEDDGMGVVTAPLDPGLGLSTYSARDEFNQTAGTLNAKTAAVGGAWASTTGPTGDFSVESTGHTVTRATTADGSQRVALSGVAAFAAQAAQIDFKTSVLPTTANNVAQGLVLRWTDTSNYLNVDVEMSSTSGPFLRVSQIVAASGTTLGFQSVPYLANTWYTLRALVTTAGVIAVWYGPRGSVLSPIPCVPLGSGVLTTGKVGFQDGWGGAAAMTRSYDNFAAWVPNFDAAIFASRTAQLTTQGVLRQDSGGTAYGPASKRIGDLPRIPPSGLESRSVEVFLKASRGDFDQLPDSGIDNISAQVFYRPSWLTAPDA